MQSTVHTDILPSFKADHAIPMITYEINKNKRGPGYWKFNCSLLEDKVFVEVLAKVLQIELEQNYTSLKLVGSY